MSGGPGRRRAAAATTRTEAGLAWSLVAPVLVLACVLGLLLWSDARVPAPVTGAPSAREVALDDVTLVCPGADLGQQEGSVAVGLLPGADPDGTVSVGDRELRPEPGGWSTSTADDADHAVAVTARGAVATSIGAWRSVVADDASGAGLATSRCARPGTDAWFLGAGSTVDHASTVVVSNAGRTPAVFDVTLLTADGPEMPVGTQGVALAAGGVQVIELADIAAGIDDVAVRVQASEGQVAASVLDRWTSDLAPAGTEWLPVTAPADTSVSMTGIPGGTRERELVVANPGERTTVVGVEVVGPETTFVADTLAELEVPGASTVTVRIPRDLEADALGLRLETDQPLLATVRSRSDGQQPDVAYAVPTPELGGGTAVPVRLGAGTEPLPPVLSLATTDTDRAATVTVAAYDAEGTELASTSVDVGAGVTVTFDPARAMPGRAGSAAYLVLTPDSGAAPQVAATYTGARGLLSVLPVATPPTTVLAPAAAPGL